MRVAVSLTELSVFPTGMVARSTPLIRRVAFSKSKDFPGIVLKALLEPGTFGSAGMPAFMGMSASAGQRRISKEYFPALTTLTAQ